MLENRPNHILRIAVQISAGLAYLSLRPPFVHVPVHDNYCLIYTLTTLYARVSYLH